MTSKVFFKYMLGVFSLTLCICMVGQNARAFCGFYVAKADATLFNKASRVVIARDGDRTVVTMASDYSGDPKDFALVVPVPEILKKEQIHVGEAADVARIDAFTAPRLVEYFDPDPCMQRRLFLQNDSVSMLESAAPKMDARERAKTLGVKIEESYSVGEYDIMLLSAKQSSGLATWLKQEGYKIPRKAEPILSSYLRRGMFFFVAKVNLERKEQQGTVNLRPLQMAYESPKFMLPVRLGTLNSRDFQELIIYTLTKNARVEPVNYRTVKVPSDIDLPVYIRDEFGGVYKDIFDKAVRKEECKAVMLEYAWQMSWCDPCAADPLNAMELRRLGAFWVKMPETMEPDSSSPVGVAPRPAPLQDPVFVTRMHARYDADTFPEDIRFQETSDSANFQARYVLRHPWKKKSEAKSCEQSKQYFSSLPKRLDEEGQNLARLTGRDITTIRKKIKKHFPDYFDENKPTKTWYEELWGSVAHKEKRSVTIESVRPATRR